MSRARMQIIAFIALPKVARPSLRVARRNVTGTWRSRSQGSRQKDSTQHHRGFLRLRFLSIGWEGWKAMYSFSAHVGAADRG
jgi:hypothetical protein